MRRLLSFECEGHLLGASLDEGMDSVGVLVVTGGTQVRVGSHRMFEKLAKNLAHAGVSTLRFDRRGVGDSEGEDPGFRASGPDISAAAEALRREAPQVKRVVGLGLCDGATALALQGTAAALDALILVNPWLVEAQPGAPAPAAVRRHYAKRLLSFEGWKKLATGAVDLGKLAGGLRKTADVSPSALAEDAAARLRASPIPCAVLLARDDSTAVAAKAELKRRPWRGLVRYVQSIPTDSHTFARPGDAGALFGATLALVRRLAG